MDQITIDGYQWVRLNDVCDILRNVRKDQVYENTDKIIRQIARLMFFDKVKSAKTEEEREAAMEFPGEFVVCKDLGYVNPNGKRLIFFQDFAGGSAHAIDNGEKAMVFQYESMAAKVAKKLGKDWKVYCVGIEDGRMTKRLLDAIFGDE